MGFFTDAFKTLGSTLGSISGIGSAIGTIGGIVDMFSGGDGSVSQQAQMDWQSNENIRQRDWQSNEAAKNRTFQEKMMNEQQRWSSIASQMQRASSAGVNPWSLVGNGGISGSTVPGSAPSGSMPASVGWPSVPSSQSALVRSTRFSQMADALAKLADAGNTGISTARITTMLGDELRKLSNEADYQDLLNKYQDVINRYAGKKEAAYLRQVFSTVANLDSSTLLNGEKLNEVRATVKSLLAKAGLDEKQAIAIQRDLDQFFDRRHEAEIRVMEADEKEKKTRSSLNVATAAVQPSIAYRNYAEGDDSSSRAAINYLVRDIQQIKRDEFVSLAPARKEAMLQKWISEGERAGIVLDTAKEMLERAKKENSAFWFDQAFNWLESLTRSVANVGTLLPTSSVTSLESDYEDNNGYNSHSGSIKRTTSRKGR